MTNIKDVIKTASANLIKKLGVKAVINVTKHFNERLIFRFKNEDLTPLEKTIEKAIEKAPVGQFRYTHPYYNITVVINKIGMNGAELVSCWKQGEEDPKYA